MLMTEIPYPLISIPPHLQLEPPPTAPPLTVTFTGSFLMEVASFPSAFTVTGARTCLSVSFFIVSGTSFFGLTTVSTFGVAGNLLAHVLEQQPLFLSILNFLLARKLLK
uniref:Uncharacterized protein n=1 Tax=Manihot esculenta TaxID=3983 RepID=A0A2C9VBP5_MANES